MCQFNSGLWVQQRALVFLPVSFAFYGTAECSVWVQQESEIDVNGACTYGE
jgi:hypothetical protein